MAVLTERPGTPAGLIKNIKDFPAAVVSPAFSSKIESWQKLKLVQQN